MQQKSLKQSASENPSLIGDPTSLKAEQSETQPRNENDSDLPSSTRAIPDSSESQNQGPKGTQTQQKSKQHKTLKEAAMENQTMLGDPVSLKAETADSHPTENDMGASSKKPAEEAPREKGVKPKL